MAELLSLKATTLLPGFTCTEETPSVPGEEDHSCGYLAGWLCCQQHRGTYLPWSLDHVEQCVRHLLAVNVQVASKEPVPGVLTVRLQAQGRRSTASAAAEQQHQMHWCTWIGLPSFNNLLANHGWAQVQQGRARALECSHLLLFITSSSHTWAMSKSSTFVGLRFMSSQNKWV
jgi:hypothetical protein